MTNKVRRFKIISHSYQGIQEAPFILDMDEDVSLLGNLLRWESNIESYLGGFQSFYFSERDYVELKPAIINGKDFLSAKVRILEFKQELMIKNLSWNTKRKLKRNK